MRQMTGPTPHRRRFALAPLTLLTRLVPAAALASLMALAGLAAGGCEIKSWLDPSELVDPNGSNRLAADGRARPRVQPILGELDLGVTRTPSQFTAARDVRADDSRVEIADYQIGPGDDLRISIPNLFDIGQPFTDVLRVSDTGLLNLPELDDPVRVTGKTEGDAARAIGQAYVDANRFVDPPNVNVLVVTAQNRTFGVLGNVPRAGRYLINRSDFRVLDAYTLAGGGIDPQTTSRDLFIIRPRNGSGGTGNTGNTGNTGQPRQPAGQGGQDAPRPRGGDPLAPGADAGDDEEAPVFALAQPRARGANTDSASGVTFEAPRAAQDFEIIRVPLEELLNGDLRYNIVVRPDDTLVAPPVITGEYYLGGHVLRPGVFVIIPGRQVTVKQAIVSGGMLDPVAIPSRTQLIRRVDDQDVFLRINLAKIFVGQEPDIFLQPNDMILVGTNLPAPFLAAFRNAFRITYGFGFLYDRNFAFDNNSNRQLF